MAEVVNLAGHTFGVIVDAGDKAVTENGLRRAGNAQVVLDVAGRLFQVEGLEVEPDRDALVQRLVRGKAELVS